MWAWGTRDDGAIGDGEPKTLRPVMAIGPTQVAGLQGITQIASTMRHNLALRSDGRVMAWGLNRDGQLGNGTRNTGWTPAEVTGLDRVVAIAAGLGSTGGNSFSGAVRDDGTVWLWGTGTSAVTGDGRGNPSPDDPGGRVLLPIQLKALTNVKALTDGSLWIWGYASSVGQGLLGKNLNVPTLLELP